MKLMPGSLLWRTFLLLTALMLLSVAAWFAIYRAYEREPRARQFAQTLVSVANLTRAALITARVESRRELLRELSDREGIHIYPAEPGDRIEPIGDRPFLQRVEHLVREELGPHTRLSLEREGERALFMNFRIDDSDEAGYWLALPRERIERVFPLGWIGWGALVLLLSLSGAWLIVFRISRPLRALERAAREIGAGKEPERLDEGGPIELATVTRAFNQMSADLARIDQDRALILAGISHDLRTPLTRLRMGIEMGGDEFLQEGMTADVEEMDKTIGQFLDFARSAGGEPEQEINLGVLLGELSAQYRRRGYPVDTVGAIATAVLPLRPQAMRRALSNLIDNALRHAGHDRPVELALAATPRGWAVEVRDRGPGIPPEEAERVKRPFAQLEAARSNAAGAGLGLAIVERIARGHGGTLDLLPRDGGGLVARILLPAALSPGDSR